MQQYYILCSFFIAEVFQNGLQRRVEKGLWQDKT